MKPIAVLAVAVTAFLSLAASSLAHTNRRQRVAAKSSTQPDQVIQWNQELQRVLVAPGAQPASIHPTRTLAITQITVYDAVNGILRGGEPLVVDAHGPRGASPDAAAAAAAHTALDALLPTQQPAIDSFFQASLAQLGSGERVERGLRFGERVADAVLAARANDGSGVTAPLFTPGAGPGEYQLTPPGFAPAAFTQTAHVTPFVLKSASQFRP